MAIDAEAQKAVQSNGFSDLAEIDDEVHLPTLLLCKSEPVVDVNHQEVAHIWLEKLSDAIAREDIQSIVGLLHPTLSWWRDILALTWDFRCFQGTAKIRKLLKDRLTATKMQNCKLRTVEPYKPELQRPSKDLVWIYGVFDFESPIARGLGTFRLIPTANGEWRAFTVLTTLVELKGFEERLGIHRPVSIPHGAWAEKRRTETEFVSSDPEVVVIGAGHNGLAIGARLGLLGVPTLLLDRHERVGDNWRTRYDFLALHDPVFSNLPLLPYPPNWPIYIPSLKLADWLENYAKTMELNTWMGVKITSIKLDEADQSWSVEVVKGDGSRRTLRPRHVIMAQGFGGGIPRLPQCPGMDKFRGKILHSTQHKSATGYIGKKIIVIGSATSAHDLCQDFSQCGIDVTMVQRSATFVASSPMLLKHIHAPLYAQGGPPTDVADLMTQSTPMKIVKELHKRATKILREEEAPLIEALEEKGFKYSSGTDGSGFLWDGYNKGGGYYLNVGASELIVEGKIKVKNGHIDHFTEEGLVFTDGSTLPADTIFFATGFSDSREGMRPFFGDDIFECNPIRGINEEGEVHGSFRRAGPPGLWYTGGGFLHSRFHSRHLALQIKAQDEGLIDSLYARVPEEDIRATFKKPSH